METIKQIFTNAHVGNDLSVLDKIHEKAVNTVIYERDSRQFQHISQKLILADFNFQQCGTVEEIRNQLDNHLCNLNGSGILLYDVELLLNLFRDVSDAKTLRVSLSTVSSDMCRRFHTDVNTLRMLCTYSGEGTLWLPEEAVDRNAYQLGKDNDEIVSNNSLIQQVDEGDILLLKGALYQNAHAALHRSPTIEESKAKRLLLRVDINESILS